MVNILLRTATTRARNQIWLKTLILIKLSVVGSRLRNGRQAKMLTFKETSLYQMIVA